MAFMLSPNLSTFNFSLTSVPLFQGDNYDFWSIQMRTLFISQGLWKLVETGYQKPTNEELATWDEAKYKEYEENMQRDAQALFIIQQGVNKTLFQEIKDVTTSKEAWNFFKIKFKGSDESEKKGVTKCFESLREWLLYEDKSQWIEQMRGMLSLVATVISTMTFQAAIDPPDGDDIDEDSQYYKDFLLFNTISFGASLGVTVLLVSGIPLKHSFPIWFLSIGMCVTLTFLGLTYYNGFRLVNLPGSAVHEAPPPASKVEIPRIRFIEAAFWVWSIFITCIALILTIRFVIWLVCVGFRRPKPPTNGDGLC